MFLVIYFSIIVSSLNSQPVNALISNETSEREVFCKTLDCSDEKGGKVCGMRNENTGFRVKVFENVCLLLKYGCEFGKQNEYGMTDMDLCNMALNLEDKPTTKKTPDQMLEKIEICNKQHMCQEENDNTFKEICAIRNDGNGFRVRSFQNECELLKYNCMNNAKFLQTEYFYCNVLYPSETANDKKINETSNQDDTIDQNDKMTIDDELDTRKNNDNVKKIKVQRAILVDNLIYNGNIKDSVETYFRLTHARKLKLKKLRIKDRVKNVTRRMVLKKVGPLVLYKAVSDIPDNPANTTAYEPTLGTCFHKCPKTCPDTYQPVCAQPGDALSSPALVFVNHCYMDQAQCRLYREAKEKSTAPSYIESQFYFCVGVEFDALYRFFPIVRTLQKLGRLKKKGRFSYKVRNFKNYNQYLRYNPSVMG